MEVGSFEVCGAKKIFGGEVVRKSRFGFFKFDDLGKYFIESFLRYCVG